MVAWGNTMAEQRISKALAGEREPRVPSRGLLSNIAYYVAWAITLLVWWMVVCLAWKLWPR